MIIKRRTAEEKLINVTDHNYPVVRKRMGWDIYYRWNWFGVGDWKLKTVWGKKFKDFEIK